MSLAAWGPWSPCGPRCLPADAPRAPLPTQALRGAGVVALLLLGLLLTPVLPLAGRHGRAWLTRAWSAALLACMGVRLELAAEPRGTSAGPAPGKAGQPSAWAVGPLAGRHTMVVANHLSWLDVPALTAIQPLRILAKRDVAGWPVIGWLATLAGTLYVDRDRLRALPGAVARLRRVLEAYGSVLVFPTGTTVCGGARPAAECGGWLGRIRPAMFQAAVDSGALIRPVALDYRLPDGRPTTIPAYVGEDSLLASVRRVIAADGLVVRVRLLRPYPADAAGGRSARKRLAARTEAALRAAQPPPPAVGVPVAVGAPSRDRVAG